MPQTMLEWAAREPALVLAFAYIIFQWVYEFARGRDARRRYRHAQRYANRALPIGATQAPAYRPALLTRITYAVHTPVNVILFSGLLYYVGRSILAV